MDVLVEALERVDANWAWAALVLGCAIGFALSSFVLAVLAALRVPHEE